MEGNNEKTELKVEPETAERLAKVAELLPRGSFKRIAEICECSDDLVGLFFKGQIPLREDNLKFIDHANKILDNETAIEERANKKLTALLTKAGIR